MVAGTAASKERSLAEYILNADSCRDYEKLVKVFKTGRRQCIRRKVEMIENHNEMGKMSERLLVDAYDERMNQHRLLGGFAAALMLPFDSIAALLHLVGRTP